jgi:hypothetical protein
MRRAAAISNASDAIQERAMRGMLRVAKLDNNQYRKGVSMCLLSDGGMRRSIGSLVATGRRPPLDNIQEEQPMIRLLRTFLLLLLVAFLLPACGGGGGDSGGGSNANTSISLDKTTVTLTADAPAQTVVATFRGDGVVVASLPGATVPKWLSVNAPATGTSPVTVTLTAFAVQQLVPGRYATTLRFASGKQDGSDVVFQDVNVTYTADHFLSPSKLYPSTIAGAPGPELLSTLNLVTDGATWEATSDQPWLTVTPGSGTGSATIHTSISPSLAVGQYKGTITVRDTLTNRTRTTTVDLAVNPRRLTVQARGIALTSTAGSTVLSKTVQVIDTANLGGRWKASSDVPWLQLTPSTDRSSLTVTADDTGLNDGIHYATVTIEPDSEPGFSNTAEIKIGLYVDHTSPAPPAAIVTGNILGAGAIVADPIRPYAYVARTIFDSASSSFNGAIFVYNFHTGQLVDRLDFPGRVMTGLTVSPDGGMLIASDASNTTDSSDRYLIPIELDGSGRTLRPRWGGIRLGIQFSYFKIAEVGGAPVVLTGEKQIVSVTDGTVLGEFEGDAAGVPAFTGKIAVSPSGDTAFVLGSTAGNHLLGRYRLTHLNDTFRALETHNVNETGTSEDIAIDPTGARFITLSADAPNPLRAYDSANVELTGSGTADFAISGSLDVAANGDIYVTGIQGTFAQYDANFVRRGIRTFDASIDITCCGRVSADGERTVVVTSGTSGVADVHLNFFDSQLPP